jgi:hypothetical protein
MSVRSLPKILALVLPLLAGGCASPMGDFERPGTSYMNDEVFPRVGAYNAGRRGEPVSFAPLTNEERDLQNQAYAILMPALPRSEWDRSYAEMRRTRLIPNDAPYFNARAYADALMDTHYRSSTARYSRLIDDIRSDLTRVGPFYASARRVVDMDTVRERSLGRLSSVTPVDHENAMARIAENRMLIGWVYRRLGERFLGYRIALEQLVVATPAPAAVDAERALKSLEERLAMIPVLSEPAGVPVAAAVTVIQK